jgi:hypothetical protein
VSGELGRVRGRKDIELLYDNLPEPIDRDLDIANRNGVLDRPGRSAARQHGQSGAYGCGARESRLMEAIGWALDVKGWSDVRHRFRRQRL